MFHLHSACMRGVWSREKRVQTGSACSLLWRVARKHAERKVLCIGKHYFTETAPRNMICKICMVWNRVVFFCVFQKGLETIGGGVGMGNKSNYWNVQIIKISNFRRWFHGLPTVNFSARAIYKEQTDLGTYYHPLSLLMVKRVAEWSKAGHGEGSCSWQGVGQLLLLT